MKRRDVLQGLLDLSEELPKYGKTAFGKYTNITTQQELNRVCTKMLDTGRIITLDTETRGLSPWDDPVMLIQFAVHDDHAFVIEPKVIEDWQPIKELFETAPIEGQNLKFDYKMLKQQFGIELNIGFDTMIAWQVGMGGIVDKLGGAGLGNIARRVLKLKMDKSMQTSFVGAAYVVEDQLIYGADDVLITRRLQAPLERLLKDRDLYEVYTQIENPLIATLGDIELNGICVDEEYLKKLEVEYKAKVNLAIGEFMIMTGGVNPASPKQVANYLKKFGVDEKDLKQPEEEDVESSLFERDADEMVMKSVGKEMLAKYADKIPAVAKLLEYRATSKLYGTYIHPLLHSHRNRHTGRVHPEFNQLVRTGRLSSRNPNLQNIPHTQEFRDIFIADSGKLLCSSDMSQAEMRILAEISSDPGMIQIFLDDQDIYAGSAAKALGKSIESITKDERSIFKAIVLAIGYGGEAPLVSRRAGISVKQAEKFIKQYFKSFSHVKGYLHDAENMAFSKGYTKSMSGRKRHYMIPDNPIELQEKYIGIRNAAYNMGIQACVAGSSRIFEKSYGYTEIHKLSGRYVDVWDGKRYSKAYVSPSGKKKVVKIELRGGLDIECSLDHKFLLRDGHGKEYFRTVEEMLKYKNTNNLRIVLSDSVEDWQFHPVFPKTCIYTNNNGVDVSLSQVKDQRELGEWLGRLAADGSIAENGVVYQLVAEHEDAILNRIKNTSSKFGNVTIDTTQPDGKKTFQKLYRIQICSKSLMRQLREIGIKSEVPDVVYSSSDMLAGYLCGMFDGDGSVGSDGAVLTFGKGCTHIKWAKQIQEALLLLGVRSRVRSYENDRTVVQILKADMPVFSKVVGFMNPVKQTKAESIVASDRKSNAVYGRCQKIKSITVTDKLVDMYDVINSETHRFMVNGLVTHNCNADMAKLAMVRANKVLKQFPGGKLMLQVHDELVFEANEDVVEEAAKEVHSIMLDAERTYLKKVPAKASITISKKWMK